MASYRGPAVLLTDVGTEFTVGADLRSLTATHESWGGLVTIAGEHWEAIKNKDKGFRLRLPTGTEASFFRQNPSESPPISASLPFRIRILGDGDAPF